MSIQTKIYQITKSFKLLLKHVLYIRLIILLFCITLSLVLMQAGSLFLLDYIPISQKVIQKIYLNKVLWNRLQIANTKSTVSPEVLVETIKDAGIDPLSDEFVWIRHHKEDSIYLAYHHLLNAQHAMRNAVTDSTDLQKSSIDGMVDAYQVLEEKIRSDLEIKQSVIALFQLLCLFFIFICLGAIAIGAKRLLINRLDALLSFAPIDLEAQQANNRQDEIAGLEQLVYIISARLKGYEAESQWFSETSGDKLRRMLRAQEFLYTFVQSVNNAALSETALRKNLYQLEKALNVQNIVLFFSENVSGTIVERILFSDHKPEYLEASFYDELESTSVIKFINENSEGVDVLHLAAGFTCPSGALGILRVDADKDRLFDETEVQLVEVTAELLSMIMGFQEREQEGRRVALLEERAAIARELHDSLAQSLSFMKIQIARLQSGTTTKVANTVLEEIVAELREGLDGAYRELRELLATFRVHIDVRGLNYTLQSTIDEFIQRSNISISFDNRLVNCRLTVNEEFHLLHVIREALSNIVRHSGANAVNVTIVFQPSGNVLLTIDDDGVGYAFKETDAGHYGQTIMKERAFSLGGDLAVVRRRNGGTRVRLVFTPKQAQ